MPSNELKIKKKDNILTLVEPDLTKEFIEGFLKEKSSPGVSGDDFKNFKNNRNLGKLFKQEMKDPEFKDLKSEEERMEEKSKSIEPEESPSISNDPKNLLAISIQQGSLLQKYVEDPTENDTLYESVDNNEPTVTILNNVMKEMAEEAAFLKAWRRENFNLKEDFSEITERRIQILNKLVDTMDKREKIYAKSTVGKIDFYGEGFKKVFESFLNNIEKTFTKVNIPDQFRSIFFAELAKAMDGFEKTAENIYYGKKKR